MVAGRELDILIAEKVMGWVAEHEDNGQPFGFRGSRFPEEYPHYSTDIAAAWEVVEKIPFIENEETRSWLMNNDAWPFYLKKTKGGWAAGWDEAYGAKLFTAEATTAPLAICLVALKSIGYK